ncbi:hypothetical protein [Glycomyces buryatensis]|uniref:Uncharacterized protein n=1 Tax=Glycomyces buryatensis TaxID=2570927 RepID=A0A4S8QEE8_9ACTN|nr:hypothetical protein [Glycomyces buryatensis]THV42997.1 hypothetical protein FAB82_03320 [Glycomyces buryatensis]
MAAISISELPARLARSGYGSAHYSIGVARRDSICVLQAGDSWVVCPKYEGHMTTVGRFSDEYEACEYVHRLLTDELFRADADGGKGNPSLVEYFAEERVPVEEQIRSLGVGTAHFSIGEVRDNAWCLVKEEGRWLVFLMKDGRRTSIRDHRWDFTAAELSFRILIKLWRRERLNAGVSAEELAADR